jgi:cyclase
MFKAIDKGKASAVAAASIFHYTEQTPMEAKEHLHKKGVPVRINKVVLRSDSINQVGTDLFV